MKPNLMNVMMVTLLALGIYGCTDDRLAGGGTDTEVSILAGTVTNGGNPVDGAIVQVDDKTAYSDVTDSTGAFSIADVPYGSHTVHAYKNMPDGKYEAYGSVTVSSANTSVGTLSIAKTPVTKRAR